MNELVQVFLSSKERGYQSPETESSEVHALRISAECQNSEMLLAAVESRMADSTGELIFKEITISQRKDQLSKLVFESQRIIRLTEAQIAATERRILSNKEMIEKRDNEIISHQVNITKLKGEKMRVLKEFDESVCARNVLEELWRFVNQSDRTPTGSEIHILMNRVRTMKETVTQIKVKEEQLNDKISKAIEEREKLSASRDNRPMTDVHRALADEIDLKNAESVLISEAEMRYRIAFIEDSLKNIMHRLVETCPILSRRRGLEEALNKAKDIKELNHVIYDRMAQIKKFMQQVKPHLESIKNQKRVSQFLTGLGVVEILQVAPKLKNTMGDVNHVNNRP